MIKTTATCTLESLTAMQARTFGHYRQARVPGKHFCVSYACTCTRTDVLELGMYTWIDASHRDDSHFFPQGCTYPFACCPHLHRTGVDPFLAIRLGSPFSQRRFFSQTICVFSSLPFHRLCAVSYASLLSAS